jgi:biopolymer transport protein ExbD
MAFDEDEVEQEMHIDMTPMVDAIFAIILFLLVTSSYVESLEQDVSINLPTMSKLKTTPKPPARPIVVNVKYIAANQVQYMVENSVMSLKTLGANFSLAKAKNKDQSVIIRGDRRVRWDHVAAVMGECAKAGIVKMSASMEVGQSK